MLSSRCANNTRFGLRLGVLGIFAAAGILTASTACGGRAKRLDQLRSDSVSAEGDIFIWEATVGRLERDSITSLRSTHKIDDATLQLLQRARANLSEATARRDKAAQAMRGYRG